MKKGVLGGIILGAAILVALLIISLLVSGNAINYLISLFFIFIFIVLPILLVALLVLFAKKKRRSSFDLSQIEICIKRANDYIGLNDAQGASSEYQKLVQLLEAGSNSIQKAELARFKSEGLKIYQGIMGLR